MKNRYTV